VTFAEWLRANSQRYLLEAAEQEMALRYLGSAPPPTGGGPQALFWRRVFVPAYRLVPWSIRRSLMQLMPGSHRRHWSYRSDRAPPGGVTPQQ